MMLLASHLFWICCHIAKITSLLRHVKAVYRQTDPSVCVHVLLQCICRPYLTVTFDLYLYAAYRNAQGSVDEDPVALLQASHTAAKPSQVWCALLLPHNAAHPVVTLLPQSVVLCCEFTSLGLRRCSALLWLHASKRWWFHHLGCFLYTFLFILLLLCFSLPHHLFTEFAFIQLW